MLLNLKEGWYLDGETSGTACARLESTETSNALYQSLCSYMQGLQAYADEPPVVITGKGAGYLYSTYAYNDSFDTTYLISIMGDSVFLACLDDANRADNIVNRLLLTITI